MIQFNIKVNTTMKNHAEVGCKTMEETKNRYTSDIRKLIMNYLSDQLVIEQNAMNANTNINVLRNIKVDANLRLKIDMLRQNNADADEDNNHSEEEDDDVGEKTNKLPSKKRFRDRDQDDDYSMYELCRDKPKRQIRTTQRYTPDNPQERKVAEEIQRMRNNEEFFRPIREQKRRQREEARLQMNRAMEISMNDSNQFRKGNNGNMFEKRCCKIDHKEYRELFDECVICHEEYCGNPVVMTECNHHFDSYCLNQWVKNGESCPICRHDFRYVTEYTMKYDDDDDSAEEHQQEQVEQEEAEEEIPYYMIDQFYSDCDNYYYNNNETEEGELTADTTTQPIEIIELLDDTSEEEDVDSESDSEFESEQQQQIIIHKPRFVRND